MSDEELAPAERAREHDMEPDLEHSSVWHADGDTYAWLWDQINNPPSPTEKQRQAMCSKFIWETDEELEQRLARYRSQLPDC